MRQTLLTAAMSVLLLMGCGGSGGDGESSMRLKTLYADTDYDGKAEFSVKVNYDASGYLSGIDYFTCDEAQATAVKECAEVDNYRSYAFTRTNGKITAFTNTVGAVVNHGTITYDAGGVMSSLVKDTNGDGFMDYSETYTIENGKITYADIDSNFDTFFDGRREYYYMPQGMLANIMLDSDLDFYYNYTVDTYYDGDDRLEEYVIDTNADNVKDIYQSYAYDGDSRRITRIAAATSHNGTPASVLYFSYEQGTGRDMSLLYDYIELGLYL